MVAHNIITKDMKISDIINICPQAPELFRKHGMDCFTCLASSAETVEEAAEMHGVDIDIILSELNSACMSDNK